MILSHWSKFEWPTFHSIYLRWAKDICSFFFSFGACILFFIEILVCQYRWWKHPFEIVLECSNWWFLMIFENFPKNPEKCLKVTHFWEFGCTQNASLLRMTVYNLWIFIGGYLNGPIPEWCDVYLLYLGNNCISCNYRAQTGVLFPLERGFMYLHKVIFLFPS